MGRTTTTANGSAPGQGLEGLLAGYANGTLDPCLHALVESHLILSPVNRDVVRAMEERFGAELDATPPAPMDRTARDHVLAAIYAGGWYGRERPARRDPDLPEPLMTLVGKPLKALPWRFYGLGVKEHCVYRDETIVAQLFKVKPGRALPAHTHKGREVTLVLKGAYSDIEGLHARGDVAVGDADLDHRPVADPKEGCICFAVTEGSLTLTGPIGRLIGRAVGL